MNRAERRAESRRLQHEAEVVAKYIANMNIDTIDIDVPVISMHSPYEVISKADLYENYLAFKAFIK